MHRSERGEARRVVVALAVAVALHVVAAAYIPGQPHRAPTRIVAAHIARLRVLRPPPTPTPVPQPTLAPIAPVASQATHVIARTHSGAQAARAVDRVAGSNLVTPPAITAPVTPAPLPSVGGNGAGAGTQAGAGSLGAGGNGSGAAASGSGSGANSGVTPCGYVNIIALGSVRVGSEVQVSVELAVRISNGGTQIARLDYPFIYPGDHGDPFSPNHRNDPRYPVTFQFPPADLRAGEPPLVQYVIAHSTPTGFTVLQPCPP